jgi:hypothetical protein
MLAIILLFLLSILLIWAGIEEPNPGYIMAGLAGMALFLILAGNMVLSIQ